MKHIIFLFSTLYVVQFSFGQSIAAQINTLIATYAKLHSFNGSVLIAQKGLVILNKGYGYRNADSKIMNNIKTIFQLGSVTKQFTSAIILNCRRRKS